MTPSETRFLVAASILHLALPAAAYIAPDIDMQRFRMASRAIPAEIDIDTRNLPPLPTPRWTDPIPMPEDATAPRPSDTDSIARALPPGERPLQPDDLPPPDATSLADTPPPENAGGGVLTADPDAGSGLPDEYSMPPGMVGYGSGEPGGVGPVWSRPGMVPGDPGGAGTAAPTRAPTRVYDKKSGGKAVAEVIRKKDAKLGLDLPAVSFIRRQVVAAIRASDTPYDCTGNLTVTLSSAGTVSTVSLNSFSGGSPSAWQNVRQQVLAQLQSHGAFMLKSAYAKGAVVGCGAVSQMKAAGGGTSREGLQINFDVADIGSRAQRIVKAGCSARPVP